MTQNKIYFDISEHVTIKMASSEYVPIDIIHSEPV